MGWFSDTIDFLTFDVFDFNDSKDVPNIPKPPDPEKVRFAAELAERKASAGRPRMGGTLLTPGLGDEVDEDIIKKKTLLGA